MAAGKYNMLIQQGATYNQTITLKDPISNEPVDITGCTAAAMVREQYSDTTPVATFTCMIATGSDGVIQISLTPEQTSAISIERGVYDLELTYIGGTKDRIIQGNVVISKEATK
jgi:hypothetical protein